MKKRLYIDMDGTLYRFPTGSFWSSSLRNQVQENAVSLLKSFGEKNPQKKLQELWTENKEGLSTSFASNYPLTVEEYFEKTRNINPEGHVDVEKKQ